MILYLFSYREGKQQLKKTPSCGQFIVILVNNLLKIHVVVGEGKQTAYED